MEDWKLKDYKTLCYNLQNKVTPFEASEVKINKQAQAIRKKYKCDEMTAYIILKKQLEKELAEKRSADNAPLCKDLRQKH